MIKKWIKNNCKICAVCLKYVKIYCIVDVVGNENKQMWFASNKEVRRMIEQALLLIIKLLFAGLVSVTIIAFALIIALVVIISKQK